MDRPVFRAANASQADAERQQSYRREYEYLDGRKLGDCVRLCAEPRGKLIQFWDQVSFVDILTDPGHLLRQVTQFSAMRKQRKVAGVGAICQGHDFRFSQKLRMTDQAKTSYYRPAVTRLHKAQQSLGTIELVVS